MKENKGISPDLEDFPRFDFSNFPRSGEIPQSSVQPDLLRVIGLRVFLGLLQPLYTPNYNIKGTFALTNHYDNERNKFKHK